MSQRFKNRETMHWPLLALTYVAIFAAFSSCMTPLEKAVEDGDTPSIRKLMDQGASVNEIIGIPVVEGNGCGGMGYASGTALHYAAMRGQTDIVQLLLNK